MPPSISREKLGLLLELPGQRENIELAARAEKAGFGSVWAPEFHNHSGPLALVGAALQTQSAELGTSIAWAFGRSPLLTAVTALDLDELSGGRFVLGLGLGDDWVGEFSAFGDEPDPKVRGRMLDEGLDVLTALLSGEPVDHDGVHYAAREVRFRPAPAVPIWLAGRFGNRAPMRRAARHDGFFVIGLERPEDLDEVTAGLAEHSPEPGF